ncbi:hypothetical protein [Oricola nitratireducens]|uniref:hypothetical protein n=1 Tax=Oricola nitratireducens TaxID=2775868 RepID=UPI001866C19E|nr:hypothetical protein [Oricola nitratireducens]
MYPEREPLHRLDQEVLKSKTVSSLSRWSDQIWRFPVDTAGHRHATANWDFELPGGSSTDDCWQPLIDLGKRLLWSIYQNNDGRGTKPLGINEFASSIRYLLQWMAWNDFNDFSEIDEHAASEFVRNVVHEKVNTDSDGISVDSLARLIGILPKIYEQSNEFCDVPGALMARHPFQGRSAYVIARQFCSKESMAIPAVPDEVFVPVVMKAYEWLEAPARDIIRLSTLHEEVRIQYLAAPSSSYTWHMNRLLGRFEFNDLSPMAEPWRQPLIVSSNDRNAAATDDAGQANGATRQLRALIQDLRSACVITLQSGTGMRVSEIAGLQAEPSFEGEWPGCVEVRKSFTGMNELFYIKGRLFKTTEKWVDTEWLAGSRPSGSAYLPPPIKAIVILDTLFRPWRERFDLSDLILSLGATGGLPREHATPNGILCDTLNRGQKLFVRDHVKLPHQWEDWNLTTHQWRKAFAEYMVRSEGSLIDAVSDHFKHMSVAVTEQGYLGNDPILAGVVDDAASREASRLLFEAVNGRTLVAGKMADIVEERKQSISLLFGSEGSDDDKIDRMTALLKEEGVRSWPAEWGDCLFREETARCHFQLKGRFDLTAHRPERSQRCASVCCLCANLMISPAHKDFWFARYEANRASFRENSAFGDRISAAVAADRVRTSAMVLRKLGIVVESLESSEESRLGIGARPEELS